MTNYSLNAHLVRETRTNSSTEPNNTGVSHFWGAEAPSLPKTLASLKKLQNPNRFQKLRFLK